MVTINTDPTPSMLRNVNGLSKGDRAYVTLNGPRGTNVTVVKCYASKKEDGARRFSVSNSIYLQNRGNYRMADLRKALNETVECA